MAEPGTNSRATTRKAPKPATLTVQRRTREYVYELADEKDWGVMFDNTVLSVDSSDGQKHYWPLDSIIRWSVK